MTRLAILSIAAIILVGFSFQASAGVDDGGDIFKWVQPPDMENGLDLQSQWDPVGSEPDIIKADDWVCPDGRPVTDIHWWGSYLYDDAFQPDGFAILIYEDYYDGTKGFYRPGALLQDYYAPLSDVNEMAIGPDSVPETVYEYRYYLPEDHWFEQEEGVRYWISIVAITPVIDSTPVWGWHTGICQEQTQWAVTGKVDQTCGIPLIPVGNPEEWAWMTYNMAFGLTTIPEPGTLALIGTAAVGLLAIRRRKK